MYAKTPAINNITAIIALIEMSTAFALLFTIALIRGIVYLKDSFSVRWGHPQVQILDKPEIRFRHVPSFTFFYSFTESIPVRHWKCKGLEREKGIEPSCVAWKATVLPLNYSRAGYWFYNAPPRKPWGNLKNGGQGRIRTFVGLRPLDLQSSPFDYSGTYPRKRSMLEI